MEHMSGGAAGHHHSKYGGEEKANSSALALHEAETKPSDLLGKVGLRCASVIMGYVLLGYCFFGLKYGWTFVDCFYFAMVTVTTVGYGDLLPEPNFADQLFTAFFAFMGVGFIGFVVKELSLLLGKMLKEIEKALQAKSVRAANDIIAQGMGKEVHHQENVAKRGSITLFMESMVSENEDQKVARGTTGWYLRGLITFLTSVIICWCVGGAILVLTEGFRFTDSFYCAAITSLSVGYGDFYPSSQEGRLCYAFYIPLSVVWILSCIGRLTMLLSELQVTKQVSQVPLAAMMTMDTDGSGQISKEEYILYMLVAMHEIDEDLLIDLAGQFDLMDTDSSRTLELADFPPGLALERTVTYSSGMISSVNLEVVPEGMSSRRRASRDAEVSKRLSEFRQKRKDDADAEVVQSMTIDVAAAGTPFSNSPSPKRAPPQQDSQGSSSGGQGRPAENLMQTDLGALQAGMDQRILI